MEGRVTGTYEESGTDNATPYPDPPKGTDQDDGKDDLEPDDEDYFDWGNDDEEADD